MSGPGTPLTKETVAQLLPGVITEAHNERDRLWNAGTWTKRADDILKGAVGIAGLSGTSAGIAGFAGEETLSAIAGVIALVSSVAAFLASKSSPKWHSQFGFGNQWNTLGRHMAGLKATIETDSRMTDGAASVQYYVLTGRADELREQERSGASVGG